MLSVCHKLVETKLRTSVEAVSFVLCPPNTIAIFQAVSENRDSPYTSDLPALCLTHRRPVRIRVTCRVEAKTKDPPYETRHCVETKTAVADSTLKTGGIDA